MKKRVLSMLLTVCLCLSLLPTAAMAEGATVVNDKTALANALAVGGTVEVQNIIYEASPMTVSKDVTLDLNGCTITTATSDNSTRYISDYLFTVTDGATLTIIDSSNGKAGAIDVTFGAGTPQAKAVIYVASNSAVEITGGSISYSLTSDGNEKCKCVANDGTFTLSGSASIGGTNSVTNSGTVNVSGGTISGDVTNNSASGVALNISGGEISGAVTNYDTCTLTISDGKISNTVNNSKGTLYANGGTISGNVSNSGTIDRSSVATSYTTFSGTVTNKTDLTDSTDIRNGEIKDAACPYLVQFNSNGGSSTPAEQHVLKGQKVTKPADPSKDGCTFDYWYSVAGSDKVQYDFDTIVDSNLTLYAHWTENSTGDGGDSGETGHSHNWAAAWSSDATHHWYDCSAANCPITDNSQKKDYAVHQWNSNTGKCNTCARPCTHDWNNGVCNTCGKTCSHS